MHAQQYAPSTVWCLVFACRPYAGVLDASCCLLRLSDAEVGEELLRRYVFIHLDKPADKLELMLAMLHKLYALVGGGLVLGGVNWAYGFVVSVTCERSTRLLMCKGSSFQCTGNGRRGWL